MKPDEVSPFGSMVGLVFILRFAYTAAPPPFLFFNKVYLLQTSSYFATVRSKSPQLSDMVDWGVIFNFHSTLK